MQSETGIRPEFDQFAGTYTELLDDPIRNQFTDDPLHFHRRKWFLMERLLTRAGFAPRQLRWLDVGCGQGDLLALCGRNFAQAIGCDPSAGMLASNASVRMTKQPSLVELPFADNSVDFVTAVCVFHHVHGTARTMLTNEIRRVLSPGGLCMIIEHNPRNPVTRAIVNRCPVDVDAELLTSQNARGLLQSSGFEPLCCDYFLFLPERLFGKFGSLERLLRKVPLGGQYALLARAPAKADTMLQRNDS